MKKNNKEMEKRCKNARKQIKTNLLAKNHVSRGQISQRKNLVCKGASEQTPFFLAQKLLFAEILLSGRLIFNQKCRLLRRIFANKRF